MLFKQTRTPHLYVSFYEFDKGELVVRLFKDNSQDNRIYKVIVKQGSTPSEQTEISPLHGTGSFLIETVKLRKAKTDERIAHCRIFPDSHKKYI